MILLDTHVFIWDLFAPHRLSVAARGALDVAVEEGTAGIAGISLWEASMLHAGGRIQLSDDPLRTLNDMLARRSLAVFGISAEIASMSVRLGLHGDPADRLIAATTVVKGATLITKDRKLLDADLVPTLW